MLESRLMTWESSSLMVERLARRIGRRFDELDTPYRVFKGVAKARLLYQAPGQRVFADLDLIVPTEHLEASGRLAIRSLSRHTARVPSMPAPESNTPRPNTDSGTRGAKARPLMAAVMMPAIVHAPARATISSNEPTR